MVFRVCRQTTLIPVEKQVKEKPSGLDGFLHSGSPASFLNLGQYDNPFDKAKLNNKGAKKQAEYIISEADKAILHGLPCIQNDSDYQGQPLGAIGDTTYKVITDKILSLIKKDGLIWRKPWNAKHAGKESLAHNYVTKTYYRGANYYLNYLLLSDYTSPYYFTFKQVEKAGQHLYPARPYGHAGAIATF